ncbi:MULTISPECIES: SLATT domain-containing protein [unclassified Variovorax]|uniref:SLATT domain-containing protein n=1 Tax=unclassified Variovorax TaxID=663243 RepID=UPI001316E2E2|nr:MULTISPECIES: SLATT domain-containing protein [unclassified Variovorax]VTU42981.1 hypothetical protein SRS16P1_00407 [Variovorax sp. SRS16]VTU43011.1 hypothetical protein E5P1_00405 [Variovorax sp. PBL-E5]VTU43538.1 hypothetical protein H6P1_00499 [Variovorax sp. PBL-H6]
MNGLAKTNEVTLRFPEQGKPVKREHLYELYSDVMGVLQKDHDWYIPRKRAYYLLSRVTLIGSTALLGFAAFLAFTDQNWAPSFLGLKFANPAQFALALAALAAFLLAANQVLMFTGTWVRYTEAAMKLNSQMLAAQFDWQLCRIGWEDKEGEASPDQQVKALTLLKTMVANSRAVMESETSKWSSELVKAVDQLKALTTSQTTATQSLITAAGKAAVAASPATLKVNFSGAPDRLKGREVVVTVGDHTEKRTGVDSSVVFPSVAPGTYKVGLVGTDEKNVEVRVDGIVQVEGGSTKDITLNVPKG